jgi:hypothetical protein
MLDYEFGLDIERLAAERGDTRRSSLADGSGAELRD